LQMLSTSTAKPSEGAHQISQLASTSSSDTTLDDIFDEVFEESATAISEAIIETNSEMGLRPHKNLNNFKISIEMSEDNKVVFKVPGEELVMEINEDKTDAEVNKLTVESLMELEALVISKVKHIVTSGISISI